MLSILIESFVLISLPAVAQIYEPSVPAPEIDMAFQKLINMQAKVKEIHPLLEKLYPVAVVENDSLRIFDFETKINRYLLQKTVQVPFPMSPGIRASFPLGSYGGKTACVISEDAFETKQGFALIFHEFIHCGQAETVESSLKNKLVISRNALKNKDYSWEINHPFPYRDSLFVGAYTGFMKALSGSDEKEIYRFRKQLLTSLDPVDFEYMVWEEWKEGFARFVENKIRSEYGLEVNEFGVRQPYEREVFYVGGSRFIEYLTKKDRRLYVNLENLFNTMLQFAH